MPMDHVKAIDEHLAERYLLQEMSADDAEDFERHFFECKECASAVEAGEMLRANGRAVVAEGWRPAAQRSAAERYRTEEGKSIWECLKAWWGKPLVWLPLAASLLLGAVAVYQGAVLIPGLRQARDAARILPAFQLMGASRGEASQISIPGDAASFAISADIPPDAQFPQYVCELSSEEGSVFQLSAPAPAAGQPITILVPAQNLHAGQYQLAIFGVNSNGQRRDKVSAYSFDFRLRR